MREVNSVVGRMRLNLFICFSTLFFVATSSAEHLLYVNFNSYDLGPYTQSMAQTDFPGAQWYKGMDEGRGEIVDAGYSGERALRMLYPANKFGPHENGLQIKALLSEKVDTAWAVYTVKFEDGFDFVRGGKLPGLCGGDCITGGLTPNGSNGWSARIMWRSEGRAVQYMYLPGYRGSDFVWDFVPPQKRFYPGEWHTVVTRVILNNPGEDNGSVYSWFDGELSLVKEGLSFRSVKDLGIDIFYISTFFGGSSIDWAPSRDLYVDYGSFLVSKDRSTKNPQALFSTTETSGIVPFSIGVDSRMSLGVDLKHSIKVADYHFDDSLVMAQIKKPGVYDLSVSVKDIDGQVSTGATRVFALDSTDALALSSWYGVALDTAISSSKRFLNMSIRLLDTSATIYVGPSITADPRGEFSLFGALRIKDGFASALDGSDRSYRVDSAVELSADSIMVSFEVDYETMTYSVWINGVSIGKDLPYRGYSKSLEHYALFSTVDRAALIYGVSVGEDPQKDESVSLISLSGKNLDYNFSLTSEGLYFSHNLSEPLEIRVYKPNGALLLQRSISSKAGELFSLPTSGVYFYRLTSSSGDSSGRLRVLN